MGNLGLTLFTAFIVLVIALLVAAGVFVTSGLGQHDSNEPKPKEDKNGPHS